MSDWVGRIIASMINNRMPSDTGGMYRKYNTELSPNDIGAYTAWLLNESARQGRDLLMDRGDYDIQGYWLAGESPDESGHGTDRYKKPNHPTFSDESIYSGMNGEVGGTWNGNSFIAGPSNLRYFTKDDLARYFELYEPGIELVFDNSWR